MAEMPEAQRQPAEQPSPPPPRLVQAAELFRGCQEICIDHDGVRYRLRITRRGRLILQK